MNTGPVPVADLLWSIHVEHPEIKKNNNSLIKDMTLELELVTSMVLVKPLLNESFD